MGWIFESTGNVITILAPLLHSVGIHCRHYPDVIMMFVLIPFAHIMNDEDTKTVISEENWYQGLKHMLGINNNIALFHSGRSPIKWKRQGMFIANGTNSYYDWENYIPFDQRPSILNPLK